MNLEELQAVRDTERSKNSLQVLRESFYADVAAFIQELRDRRNRAASEAEDPFDDPDIQRLTDEISSAEQTVEAIYERRIGKLVKQASFAAASMPTDEEGLTREEQALYSDLVELIRDNRREVLATIADGDDPTPSASRSGKSSKETTDHSASMVEDEDRTERPAVNRERGAGSGAVPPDEPGSKSDETAIPANRETDPIPRTTVRITADVGEIVGIDERTYDLARDDVVTLPEPNAQPLLEREAATKLE